MCYMFYWLEALNVPLLFCDLNHYVLLDDDSNHGNLLAGETDLRCVKLLLSLLLLSSSLQSLHHCLVCLLPISSQLKGLTPLSVLTLRDMAC